MKRLGMILMFLAATMAVGISLKAQEVTRTLMPGWTWISCPTTDTMDFATALGSFVPMPYDIITTQGGVALYMNGRWMGTVSQFYPGYGYHYKSNRTEPVTVAFQTQQPFSQVVVATLEPTDITSMSAVAGSTVTIGEGNHVFARGVCWGTEPNPDIDGNHTTDAAVTGSISDTLTELTLSTTYYVRAYMVTDYGLAYGEELSFTTESHAYVDLGLPSGLLWATCNVGADNPEDYGDYFAWGETEPKDTYNWSTYLYCNGSYNTLTKYCTDSEFGYNGFTDNLTTLLPEDDAATANWGSGWRMPTQTEFQELIDNTTATLTTQNGVNGYLFTASNGNSLFLPAAGYHDYSSLSLADSLGNYSSSSLFDTDVAWSFGFNSGGYAMIHHFNYGYRSYGRSVRPVRVGSQSNAPTGAIDGKFTINAEGDQVYFSQGNLQYQASTNTWRFAENQYDYVGNSNSNISSVYSGWIDLFSWGTSGWNNGNIYYQPWSSAGYEESNHGQLYGPLGQYNLTVSYANADWGVYNQISNGGNQTNQWRTLTQPEWNYVFDMRTTTSGIRYAKAIVNNVNGVILLPDDWSSSTYNLSNTNSSGASFSSNTLTASQWSTLEQAGAVFLPAAGHRIGTSLYSIGSLGCYWSASYYDSYNACSVGFGGSGLYTGLYTDSSSGRYYGFSVRVVCPAEN